MAARRANTGYQDGFYHVPAGHVEEGELPTEAVIRETREEVNVDLKPADVELAHVSYRAKHDPTGDRIDFFFRARRWNGEIKNMEPHKCDELKWVLPGDLPENMALHIRRAVEAMGRGLFFEEIGLDEVKKHGLYVP